MTLLFIILLGIGVIYSLVILVGSGIAHLDLPGIDLNLDHGGHIDFGGEVKIPSLSPIAIASFVTAFGAFGLIGQWLSSGSVGISLLSAGLGGFVIALLAHLAFTYFLIKPQGSSEVTAKDVVGAAAEVVQRHPAANCGSGFDERDGRRADDRRARRAVGERVLYLGRSRRGRRL